MTRHELGDWDDLRIFLAVARVGSFSRAAEELRINQATVSRRIEQFEERLGTKLFDRHGRGVILTPSAEGILDGVRVMESTASVIERQLVGRDREMEGVVRIATTEGVGSYWLTPRLLPFQRAHPRIVVEILTGTRQLDLAAREADLAIRLARPADPRLVAVQVGVMRFSLFCSKDYANVYGTPRTAEDLRRHRIVDHDGYDRLDFWQALVAGHEATIFRSNSTIAHLEAVRSGAGIGMFPTFARFTAPDLLMIPDIPLSGELGIWLVSHEETRVARTRAVIGYVRDLFDRDRATWFS